MLDWERLECDAADIRGRAFLDQLTIGDVAAFQRPPCFLRRMHRAGGAVSQAPGVVRGARA